MYGGGGDLIRVDAWEGREERPHEPRVLQRCFRACICFFLCVLFNLVCVSIWFGLYVCVCVCVCVRVCVCV